MIAANAVQANVPVAPAVTVRVRVADIQVDRAVIAAAGLAQVLQAKAAPAGTSAVRGAMIAVTNAANVRKPRRPRHCRK